MYKILKKKKIKKTLSERGCRKAIGPCNPAILRKTIDLMYLYIKY